MRIEKRMFGRLDRLAVCLVAALVLVLGLCPAIALAGEVEVEGTEPEGTVEPVGVVQGEELAPGPVDNVVATTQSDTVDVKYLDENGEEKTISAIPITRETRKLEAGDSVAWYVVDSDVEIGEELGFAGEIHLILVDGRKLTVGNYIYGRGNLTVYGQSGGTGKLVITGNDNDRAINCYGNLTISGGTVNATSNYVGIGCYGGNLTISGGTVNATGNAGIDVTGNLTISGGAVNATGKYCGIAAYGNVQISGGTVNATGKYYGIEAYGDAADQGNVQIGGGTVTAIGEGDSGSLSYGYGISGVNVTIKGGAVTAQGLSSCISIEGSQGQGVTIDTGINVKARKDGETSAAAVDREHFQKNYRDYVWAQTTSDVAVQSVTVDPATKTLTVGETVELKATVAPDDATDKAVTWKSSNESVAKVDTNGKVTAVAPGEATITATAGGKSGTCKVTVKAKEEKKEEPVAVPDASVAAHVQRIGWMDPVTDGTAAGTTGKSRRMEALTLKLPDGVAGGIEYRGHVQRSGWEKTWATDGNVAGTTGKSRRVEAVQIQLTGEAKDAYDVYYRVHVQKYGWMAWAKNGEEAGTQGMSRRAEAIQVVLVKKDAPAPDATYKGVTQQYAKAFVKK